MYSKAKITQAVIASTMLVLTLGGCVKQRPEIQSQGDRYQVPVSIPGPATNQALVFNADSNSFTENTAYTIKTAPVALIPAQNSVAEEIFTESESGIKFLDIANFESDHPLLAGKANDAYMLGEPNKTYGVAQELTPKHLIIYKVVDEQDLAFSEKTIATAKDGKWLVPVGGYPVTYFRRARVVNEDNRETNLTADFPIPGEEFRTATSYRVNKADFLRFERLQKEDTLPKDFFNGEWYFSETTVDTSYASGGVVGDLGAADSNFSSATKIRFRIYDDQLVGENTNVDEEFKDDPESLNYATVFKIDIEHEDYRWFRTGPDALKEVQIETQDKDSKKYIKLDYNTAATPTVSWTDAINSLFGSINNFRNIRDITYGKDYFSFSVRDSQTQSIKRFSMRKITQSQMAPRQAFKDDNRVFGAFTTVKAKKLDYKVNLQEDVDALILMARHNPNKDIVYYFTTGTPKDNWHRDIARESISLWQQAFKKAGLSINIRLDESKDVQLGDIRYNVINIVKRAGSGLLGFGPSLIDSDTGEIVSASMNSGTDGFLEQYFGIVRDYIGRKAGYYYNLKADEQLLQVPANPLQRMQLFKLMDKINSGLVIRDSKSGRYRFAATDEIKVEDNLYTLPAEELAEEKAYRSRLDLSSFSESEVQLLSDFGINQGQYLKDVVERVRKLHAASVTQGAMTPFVYTTTANLGPDFTSTMVMDNAISKNCPEVDALAERLKNNPMSVSTPEEIQIIKPCVDMFSQIDAVSTVVHEIGHNLSLRHNFKGSVDQANWPVLNDYQLNYIKMPVELATQMSSSIMEYASSEGQQVMPGEYDIAAIRWIYKGEVEKTDGSVVRVDISKPMARTVPLRELKPYMFCTDEHRILVTDVMCDMHDKGLTAKEAVRYSIETVYNALPRIYRYDRFTVSQRPYNLMLNEALSLKTKYDQWRGFLRKYTGMNKGYLQGYTVESYAQLIEEIRKQEPEALAEHLEVRNMIAKFLVDIAFISNRYCVVEDSNKIESLYELEKVRRELFGYGEYAVIDSCSSEAAKKFFDEKQLVVKGEFGHFLDGGRFDLDPAKVLDPNDFGGTSSIRMFAMLFLNMRISPSINNILENFNPSMLDEPDLRNYIQFLIMDRLVNGVRIAHDNSRSEYAIPKTTLFGSEEVERIQKQKAFVNFNDEGPLVQAFTGVMAENLWMPGVPDDGRLGNVSVTIGDPSQIQQIQQIAQESVRYLNRIYYVENVNTFAGQILRRFKFLSNQKSRMQVSPESISAGRLQAMTVLNQSGALFVPLKVHTLLDMLNLLFAMDAKISEFMSSSETRPVGFALLSIMNTEYALLSQFEQQLQAQGLTLEQLMTMKDSENAEEKAAANQMLSQPIAPVYDQLKQQDPDVRMPTYAEMNRRFDVFLARHTEEYNNFNRSALEYDSQIDILQRVIQILSR